MENFDDNLNDDIGIIAMSEKWYKFIRYTCKDGFIDRWLGDLINNPNNENKHQQSLNSFSEYYRINEGVWFHKDCFKKGFYADLLKIRFEYSAHEIWDVYKMEIAETKPNTFEQKDVDDVRIIIYAKGKHYGIVPNHEMCDSEQAKKIRIEILNILLKFHFIVEPALEDIKK